MQYIYEDQYKGKPRKLLILPLNEADEYRVFCEADFLGSLRRVSDDGDVPVWKSEYNILKPVACKIGAYIESCK